MQKHEKESREFGNTSLDIMELTKEDLGQLVEILLQGPTKVKKPNKSEAHDLGRKWKSI